MRALARVIDICGTRTAADWLETEFFPLSLREHRAARDRCAEELDALGIRYVVKPRAGWYFLLDLSEASVRMPTSERRTARSARFLFLINCCLASR